MTKKKKKKNSNEKESRESLLSLSNHWGCQGDVKKILDRYDRLLKNCSNEQEYHDISTMGLVELHKLLGCRGPLVVNGIEVLPAEEGYEEEPNIIKL